MWKNSRNEQFFKILRDNASKIMIEVMGHDHYADLRYHSSSNVVDMKDPSGPQFDFHNMFVSPGITPNKYMNPGVAHFEISDEGVPGAL